MNVLLDTHVALWAIAADDKLSAIARRTIAAPDNTIFISVVTLWEIAIKFALRRGRSNDMPISAEDALENFTAAGYEILQIEARHALAVAGLPNLHGDPFDRMLIAQARSEPLRLLTANTRMAAYGASVDLV